MYIHHPHHIFDYHAYVLQHLSMKTSETREIYCSAREMKYMCADDATKIATYMYIRIVALSYVNLLYVSFGNAS